MDSKSQLHQLFTYDLWSNQKVTAVLDDQLFDDHQKCAGLLTHIGAAQKIWYHRIKGQPVKNIDLWPQGVSVSKSLENINKMNEQWLDLLAADGNLDEVISYRNSSDTTFNTPLAGILHHIIIHGQHHRAQIAALLRTGGVTPPGTDFLFYLREADNK